MSKPIQLNADLGEGAQVEDILMPHLSYCNIACGGHYGDTNSMQDAVNLAVKHKVKIGVHPSYPDKQNFGRAVMDITLQNLKEELRAQLMNFKNVCISIGAQIHHIKAHGALYHQILLDNELRLALLEIVHQVLGDVKIIVPAHVHAKDLNLDESKLIYEAFADRQYNDQMQLLSRSDKGAVLNSLETIEKQIIKLSQEGEIVSNTGLSHSIQFDTICIHGDHQKLETIFPTLVKNLRNKGLLL